MSSPHHCVVLTQELAHGLLCRRYLDIKTNRLYREPPVNPPQLVAWELIDGEKQLFSVDLKSSTVASISEPVNEAPQITSPQVRLRIFKYMIFFNFDSLVFDSGDKSGEVVHLMMTI